MMSFAVEGEIINIFKGLVDFRITSLTINYICSGRTLRHEGNYAFRSLVLKNKVDYPLKSVLFQYANYIIYVSI